MYHTQYLIDMGYYMCSKISIKTNKKKIMIRKMNYLLKASIRFAHSISLVINKLDLARRSATWPK